MKCENCGHEVNMKAYMRELGRKGGCKPKKPRAPKLSAGERRMLDAIIAAGVKPESIGPVGGSEQA